ncbi:MAG: hypothetical protein US25_C0001G0009 [Candidatus Moranbacteria bacterium GW2011_GWE1_36_7]|nr:MAG: hypothetical protein UR99_C0005G0012 [Candidatus Moranbacteria bacterium GW2011_GWD2_36_12]KKQ06996.1 MAG: hypothetical protein US16_C0004G0012 [Candidatus Moranbacteria bacterium GW2011_GWE2_36_40]KKQ15614.1 MAG: hypothetical protein US25_C0001G0009 [Candidatus Moranbacteria bacterium GW2011_GWE1_36_7]
MTKFSENIIGKIKNDCISPVPKWHFLLKNYAFWVMLVVSVILGSLSFSVIVHIANSGDIDLLDHMHGSLISSAVMMLPYFWLLSVAVFMLVAYCNWKHTKMGYRFKRRWIVLGSFLGSIFLGSIFYAIGMAKEVDGLMTTTIPIYNQSKHDALRELWFQPEKGLLVGKIIEIDEVEEKLVLRDESGKKWIVDDRAVGWENDELEKRGKIIKVIGLQTGEAYFEAKEIRRCNNCQDDEDEDFDDEKWGKDEKNTHKNIILKKEDLEKEASEE